MEFKYKINFSEKDRIKEFQELHKNHPNKYPIVFQKTPNSSLNDTEKPKYLIDPELSFRHLNIFIKRKIHLEDENKNLRFLVNGAIPIKTNQIVKNIFEQYRDKDGFLYLGYELKKKKLSVTKRKYIFLILISLIIIIFAYYMPFLH